MGGEQEMRRCAAAHSHAGNRTAAGLHKYMETGGNICPKSTITACALGSQITQVRMGITAERISCAVSNQLL